MTKPAEKALTPIDKIRAALERADVMIYGNHHDNEQLKTALVCIKEALSELDGCVIVNEAGQFKFTDCTDIWVPDEKGVLYVTGKIDPYVNGEKK